MTTNRRPAYLAELGFVAVALACYLLVGWYTHDSTDAAVRHARSLIRLEHDLGVDWEHAVQDVTLAVPGMRGLLTQFYVWGYLPTLIVLVVWLYARHREPYRRLRNALLGSGVVGLLVYAFYPCAPPWIGGTGFTDTVATGAFESVARPHGITNHLGALPSFHVGWVILVAVVVFRVARTRTGRVLAVVYPILMAYAVVATGNHWVLDVPAGALLAGAGLLVASTADRTAPMLRSLRPASPPPRHSSTPA